MVQHKFLLFSLHYLVSMVRTQLSKSLKCYGHWSMYILDLYNFDIKLLMLSTGEYNVREYKRSRTRNLGGLKQVCPNE